MHTVTINLKTLIKDAEKDLFKVPHFQRDFVWKISQIKLLVDSLLKNYPIGSLLVLSNHPEIRFSSRSVRFIAEKSEGNVADNPSLSDEELQQKEGDNIFYVLDGQQRITSLCRCFLPPEKRNDDQVLYFNLEELYRLTSQGEASLLGSERPAYLQKKTNKGDCKKRLLNNKLLRCDVILDAEETDVFVSEFFEDSDASPVRHDKSEARKAAARIKKFFEVIRGYDIPMVVLDKESSLDAICRIFETINSTGTKLTTFDLAVARFHPDPDLRLLYENALSQNRILKEVGFEGDRLLQLVYLVSNKKQNSEKKYFEPSRSELLRMKPEIVKEYWVTSTNGAVEAAEWLKDTIKVVKSFNYPPILVSLGAFFALYSDECKDIKSDILLKIRRWLFTNLMVEKLVTANYAVAVLFQELCDFIEQPIQSKQVLSSTITPDKIAGFTRPTDGRYRGILALFASNGRDFYTGRELKEKVDVHHIFPKAMKDRVNASHNIDSISNKVYINETTNRQLNDKEPAEYFRRLIETHTRNDSLNSLKEQLKQNFIPGDIASPNFLLQFEPENFSTFLSLRSKLIYEGIISEVGGTEQNASMRSIDEESEIEMYEDD